MSRPGRQEGRPVRVAVVDDHAVVTSGLAADLAAPSSAIEVVARHRTATDLVASGVAADVVVLDLQLDDGSRPGANVAAVLATGARVLLFSAYEDAPLVMEAVRAGAHGYLNKSHDVADVAAAVHEIAAGGEVVSAELLIALSAAAEGRPDLAGRQEEVLIRYTSSDAKLPAVARQLGMAPETLKTHLRRIKEKYAAVGRPASTRLELYRRAVEDGYVSRDGQGPGA